MQAFPKIGTSLEVRGQLMRPNQIGFHLHWSTCLASRFSTQKEPFLRSEFTPALYLDILDADRLPNAADSPRSSPGCFITMVKLEKRLKQNCFENEKKPERPRRSVRKIDEYVIYHACKDACVKFANVKSVTWEMFATRRWDTSTRTPCV